MGNDDSNKPDEPAYVPFSEFKFFDDLPSSELPWNDGSSSGGEQSNRWWTPSPRATPIWRRKTSSL